MGINSDIIICDDCWVWCEPKNRCGKTPQNTPKPSVSFKKQDLAPVKSPAKPAAAVLPPSPPAQRAAAPEKTYVIKFSSNSCGICGRMAHYDKKVIEELGLTYDYAKRSEPKTWNNFRYLAKQLYPNPESMGFPTYIIAKGSSKDKLTAIGQVRGGSEKGNFRKKIQAVLNSEPVSDDLTKLSECAHLPQGKGTSGSANYWADVYENCNLKNTYVMDNGPRSPKSDERRGKYRQWISTGKPGEQPKNGEHIFHLSDKDTEEGGGDGGGGDGGGDGGGGGGCDDWTLKINCPGPADEGSGLTISANADGINNSKVTFKWYIGSDKQSEGETYQGIYPACGTSVTFKCVAQQDGCDKKQEKTCTVTSNPCGGGGGDPCDGVTCPPGQHCENGNCVDDGGGGGGNPCDPDPCGPGEECWINGDGYICRPTDGGGGNPCIPNPCPDGQPCMTNGDGTYQCIDPCENANCPDCHICVQGICVDQCSPGQICENGTCKDPDPVDPCDGVDCDSQQCLECVNGVCVSKCTGGKVCDGNGNCIDPDPVDPCDGVVCGDCEQCVNGVCESTCAPGQICEGGVCKDPPPIDPCDGVVCPDGEECKDGICVPIDPCEGVICPDGEECKDGICVPIDPCEGVVCPDGQECKDGICVPIDPCEGVICPDGEECKDGICVPIDLCEGVVCGDCQECQGGVCVDLCSPGQICEGGVCKDPDPCEGVNCGECQECQNGVCVDLCVEGELCEGGVCVPDPCYNVTCPECHECVDGSCESLCNEGEICENGVCVPDPCYNVDCPECHECVDGNCESICTEGELCENGVCVPDPCYNVECQDCEECQDGNCIDLCPEGEVCDGNVCRDERCLEHECEGGWVIDWECVKNKLNCDGPDCPTPPPDVTTTRDQITELPSLDSDEKLSEVSTDLFDNLPELS